MTKSSYQVNHLFIIDASAEQGGAKSSITSQVNDSIESIKLNQDKETRFNHRLTMFLFQNNNLKCLYSDVGISDVRTFFNNSENRAIGQTLDAIGSCIATWRALNAKNRVKGKFQVTIFSSGRDKNSRKYGLHTLKSIIESLSITGWQFTIVSSNVLLPRIAGQLGIKNYYVCRNTKITKDRNFLINQLKKQWVNQNSVYSTDKRIEHAA